nr:hypothetical protein [Tanacetum cinerariifolium]
MEAGSKDRPPMLAPDWKDTEVPISEGIPITTTERIHETYKNVSQEIRDQLNAEAEAVQIILTGIDNDIHSTVDACPNACGREHTRYRTFTLEGGRERLSLHVVIGIRHYDEVVK